MKIILNIKNIILENRNKILLINIFLLLFINSSFIATYAQSLSYTLFKSQNKGFILRYPTNFGNYNFELSKSIQNNYIIPTIYFYSTNTSNNTNANLFMIRHFFGRTLLYSHNTNTKKTIIVGLNPGEQDQGNIYFYHYSAAPNGGYYARYSKIYGDISNLIAIYNCEDDEWNRNGGSCLGPNQYCFGRPYFGKVIHNGILMGNVAGAESGLTICVRTKL
ncbi:MAG: hypothetical protein KatS3mg095_0188 [Candidatus Parcubacteria bacterium]|nr:MAG: hypothetical protein KatS3mg095_0188 [Candidatus Parcubacteria bacterium]